MTDTSPTPRFSERVRRHLYDSRVLVLDGPLDDDNGTLLTTSILTLAMDDPTADIALWIHSPGGSVPSMLAIRDVMNLVPCDVSTLALGIAYSAGQFLLSSGTPGKRRALPHARVLMHQGSCGKRPPCGVRQRIGGIPLGIEVKPQGVQRPPARMGSLRLELHGRMGKSREVPGGLDVDAETDPVKLTEGAFGPSGGSPKLDHRFRKIRAVDRELEFHPGRIGEFHVIHFVQGPGQGRIPEIGGLTCGTLSSQLPADFAHRPHGFQRHPIDVGVQPGEAPDVVRTEFNFSGEILEAKHRRRLSRSPFNGAGRRASGQ